MKKKGADKTNAMQRLVRVFSDVFMPILPALIIAGLLMGVNNLMGAKGMFIEGRRCWRRIRTWMACGA